jgi:RNA polymerase sigma-70 factor (ECF subfamily)
MKGIVPFVEDIEIIQEVLRGSQEACAALVRRHHARTLVFCLSLLRGNRAEADDAAQEVFLKAFKALPGFRGESSFSTWLYRIAYNHCTSQRKSIGRRASESLDAFLERGYEKAGSPHKEAHAEADVSDLAQRALASLSTEDRAVMSLRLSGLKYEEICETMKMSMDAVKARLRRSRGLLREKFGHFLSPRNV